VPEEGRHAKALGCSCHRNPDVDRWNVKKDEEIMTLSGHSNTVNSCAFSPDGVDSPKNPTV